MERSEHPDKGDNVTSDDDILIENIKKKNCCIKLNDSKQISEGKKEETKAKKIVKSNSKTVLKKETSTVIRKTKSKTSAKESKEAPLNECKVVKKGKAAANAGDAAKENPTTSNNKTEKKNAVVKKRKSSVKEKKDTDGKPTAAKVVKKRESKVKKETNKRPKKVVKKTEENFEPINRWWEKIDHQTDVQWHYLEHRGLIFSPPYVQHNIPIFYKSIKLQLNEKAEELATYWCSVIGSDYCTKEKFILNFFRTFICTLEKDNIIRQENESKLKKGDISNFKFIDFMPIKDHLVKLREEKLNRTKEEKEEEKKLRSEKELPYTYALVDWIREKISSNKAEPPGLFRGRGEHPKQGLLKKRIFPEDVVINISKDAPVPRLYDDMCGHCWGDTYHDNKVTWLAYYKDSINDQLKYTFLSAQSKFKGYKDFLKYENARKLKSCVHKIREDYRHKMRNKSILDKQLGTAVYLIDFLALRVGGEKDIDEEADTVGCCSLRVEHVSFSHEVPIKNESRGERSKGERSKGERSKGEKSKGEKSKVKNGSEETANGEPPNEGTTPNESDHKGSGKLPLPKNLDDIEEDHCYLTFDFLGKDSIRYFNTVKLDKQAYINMIIFCKKKHKDEGVFDQINCSKLNDYLKEIMPTLSAKVFRTYNASITLDQQLKRIKEIRGKPTDPLLSCYDDLPKRKKRKLGNATSSTSILSDTSDSTQNEPSGDGEEGEKKKQDDGDTAPGDTAPPPSRSNTNALGGIHASEKNSPIEVDVSNVNELINFFNNANREVAILCNHQRSVPKQHDSAMSKIKKQIEIYSEDIKEYKKYLQYLKKGMNEQSFTFVSKVVALDGSLRPNKVKENMKEESCKKKLIALIKKVEQLKHQMKVRDDNKTIALGTSKINYMDPRITVAFCKRFEIPIEKIFNRSLRLKFPWAMFVTKNFTF
ncbi:topoisomerase I, putative [Plasmodium vivax]|uniref:DNA topoisomerase 1 n=2 Tax=Plasmodium vivax TaxID=5855 RepID=A5KB33_PLAVS|nr:topoisomerase I, putative [Plasmodium vivax]EDL43550.1 topoisomerase I, putative [Plasmodium vivax]KMZ92713.1 topoisomerase I [Plasmodium vivax Mauritania I]CAI7721031.1 topoisomerase I, putative [Plasmodium vivax]|eukprot:XP_001613277.1 topoisomerase I [Plasmodium vivax Sal-1]